MTHRLIAVFVLMLAAVGAQPQVAAVVGKPYVATEETTFLQHLADGTTIQRVTTRKEARDSEGRTRQEVALETRGGTGAEHALVSINDPVAHTATHWFTPGKEVTRIHTGSTRLHPGVRPSEDSGSHQSGTGILSSGKGIARAEAGATAFDRERLPALQREALGGKTLAGVYAEGVRITRTWPVNSEGNDRPISEVHETWTSPELKIVVLRIDEDPRTGVRTTEIKDLEQVEPDPSLFLPPEGYTVKDRYPEVH